MFEKLKFLDSISSTVKALPNVIATEAVNFSKERFVQQNWVDTTTEPWRKRKYKRKSKKREQGAVLVSSVRLKRSIKKILVSSDCVVIGSDVPYAAIHNNGFRGKQTVKSHRRTSRNGRRFNVESFTRNINMPRRRFLGQSMVLNKRLERVCTARIMQSIKSVVNDSD